MRIDILKNSSAPFHGGWVWERDGRKERLMNLKWYDANTSIF